jgi:hypothetical protein
MNETTTLATTTIVLVVRDPDYDNSFTTFEGAEPGVAIFDIDLGRSDLSDEDELAEWKDSHEADVAELRAAGRNDAADAYQQIIDERGGD